MSNHWPTIHAERRSLADDLESLDPAQWSTPSLCSDWTVQDALAHMTSTAEMTPFRFITSFAGSGFNFAKFASKAINEAKGQSPAETLAAFRAATPRTTSPPGPKDTWLGETIVHAEDIRRPLGISHEYPLSAVTQIIEFYSGSEALIGGKSRVAGLTLKATDTDFTHGSGDLVEGPALDLLLATTGRAAGLAALSGPGLDTLRSRA